MANLITDFELCKGSDLQNAANMLRQQADRIAELEKEIEGCKETNGRFVDLIQEYRKEWNKQRGIE